MIRETAIFSADKHSRVNDFYAALAYKVDAGVQFLTPASNWRCRMRIIYPGIELAMPHDKRDSDF
jgi:hypothetical protein